MTQASEANRHSMNAFSWPVPAFLGTPMVSLVADFNGKLLQSVAGAQKEWADFVHRRLKEDVAVSQQLISCQSLADMQEVYSNYLQRAFEHYQEQTQRAVQRAQSSAEEFVEATGSRAKEAVEGAPH
jgi:phasin protein